MNYHYVTAATGGKFITKYAKFALKSLLKAGVDPDNIHVAVNAEQEIKQVKKIAPGVRDIGCIDEDLSVAKWKSFGGIRKYSLFKAAALHKKFGKPYGDDSRMIYFDCDVLWYKNPAPFWDKYNEKTWFHHGKVLEKRASIKREDVDLTNVSSLSKWMSLPAAYLIAKHGAKVFPEREVVAGLYMLHPRDHEEVLKKTYEFCIENAAKFLNHEGAGDQKPMNAALTVLGVDWHGGSRFFCPEHEAYFDHYFGKQQRKKDFWARAERMGL